MSLKEHVVYKENKYFIQSSGRYYSCGNKTIKPRLLHRKVWFDHYGDIPKGHVVHHIDGNWRNNHISNLEVITVKKHLSDHNKEWRKDPEYVRKTMKGLDNAQIQAKKWHASKEGIEWHKKHGKECWANRKQSIIKCVVCSKERLTPFPSRTRFCSSACAQKVGYQRYKTEERICIKCGKSFIANKHRKTVSCGYSCAAIRRWEEKE